MIVLAESSLLTEADIKAILKPKVDEIKGKMDGIVKDAVSTFYGSGSSGSYSRTGGLQNILTNNAPDEQWDADGVTLTYHFSSDGVSVNSWDSPWGITYPGNPEIAFGVAFDVGYHGGPKPYRNNGEAGWTWAYTQQSDPIYDLIMQGVNSLL